MKIVLIVLFLFVSVFSSGVTTGGAIPIINNVITNNLDLSYSGNNTEIANFVINNNTQYFELKITFPYGPNIINEQGDTVFLNDLIITEGGQGVLGKGITPLKDQKIILNNNEYIWKPEKQSSATIGYLLKIKGSWNSINIVGLYKATAIVSIIVGY